MSTGERDRQRRLAAILAADAAGFSRSMALDEAATMAALDAARACFRTAVDAQRGRVVDTAGDSVLAVFATASEAIAAALAVQRTLESGACDRDGARLRFRIGVHLGEVTEKEDGSVYGDGVNVAARLQAIATPGGVTVSQAVRGAVGERLGIAFADFGLRSFKNIAEPIHVYALDPAASGAGGTDRLPRTVRSPGRRGRGAAIAAIAVVAVVAIVASAWLPLPGRLWSASPRADASPPPLSVAVLPFVAADPEHAGWADALTQSTTTALSQWRWATVAAPGRVHAVHRGRAWDARQLGRELGVRYLAEAELRSNDGKVGTLVRLTDAETGTQVWARQFEVASPPSAEEKALLAGRVAARFRNAVIGMALDGAARSPASDSPLVEVARGGAAWANDDNAGWRAARVHYDKALALDPRYMPALVRRAWTLDRECNSTETRDPRVLAEFEAATARAIAVDNLDDEAWMARSVALSYLFRWGEAVAAIERAITLAPYEPSYVAQRANLHQAMGRQAEAEAGFLQAIAMDPPGSPFMHRSLCAARLLMGRYDQAAPHCERAAAWVRWYEDQMLLTAIHAQRGDAARTEVARAELLRQRPALTIENNFYRRLSDTPAFQQQLREHLESGLRKAGIPER